MAGCGAEDGQWCCRLVGEVVVAGEGPGADDADEGAPGRGAPGGREPERSEESSEVRWAPRKDLGGYAMDRSMRLRIGHYLKGRVTPYLG